MEEEVNVCVREHTKYKGVEEKLGKGSHATVWQLGPTWALKVIKPEHENSLQQDAIKRELYIYAHVPDIQRIAPILERHWTCKNADFFQYEKFDGDMEKLGRLQFQASDIPLSREGYNQFLFTQEQFLTMVQLTKDLGQKYKVLHLDVRVDQFFYKTLPNGKIRIVIADFGFAHLFSDKEEEDDDDTAKQLAAEVGWEIWHGGSCDRDHRVPAKQSQIPSYLRSYNQFQLLADLTANESLCYILMPNGEIRLLMPDREFNDRFRHCNGGHMRYVTPPSRPRYAPYRVPSSLLV